MVEEEDQLLYNNENIVQFQTQSFTVIGAKRKTTGKQMTPSEYLQIMRGHSDS